MSELVILNHLHWHGPLPTGLHFLVNLSQVPLPGPRVSEPWSEKRLGFWVSFLKRELSPNMMFQNKVLDSFYQACWVLHHWDSLWSLLEAEIINLNDLKRIGPVGPVRKKEKTSISQKISKTYWVELDQNHGKKKRVKDSYLNSYSKP